MFQIFRYINYLNGLRQENRQEVEDRLVKDRTTSSVALPPLIHSELQVPNHQIIEFYFSCFCILSFHRIFLPFFGSMLNLV